MSENSHNQKQQRLDGFDFDLNRIKRNEVIYEYELASIIGASPKDYKEYGLELLKFRHWLQAQINLKSDIDDDFESLTVVQERYNIRLIGGFEALVYERRQRMSSLKNALRHNDRIQRFSHDTQEEKSKADAIKAEAFWYDKHLKQRPSRKFQ